MRLTFLGGAGEVTGSSLLVETAGCRCLIDAGMFQGDRYAGPKNRAAALRDLGHIDFVVLTHAHIDHSGLLPALRWNGPPPPILCTSTTADLLDPMLRDSAHIQSGNGRRHPTRAAAAAPPLYGTAEVDSLLRRLRPVEHERLVAVRADAHLVLHEAGHIPGAAWAELRLREGGRERILVASGDIGAARAPLVPDPVPYSGSDLLVLESTYGDRNHRSGAATEDELVTVLHHALHERRGMVIVPSFAVGRTQQLLIMLYRLCKAGRLRVPLVIVDSPLAQRAGAATFRHRDALDEEAREFADAVTLGKLPFSLRYTESPRDSMQLAKLRAGAVIIAASGMCEAGRIRHHLLRHLPRPESAVLFVGFQAQGTLGRRLVDGARSITLFGERVPVRASLHTINGLSAHAGQDGLLDWARAARRTPQRVFVNHGEPAAAHLLAARLIRERGWRVEVAAPARTYEV